MTTTTLQAGYKMTEIGVIPEDWEVKEVRDIVDFTNGKAHENHISDSGRYIVVNSKFISSEGEVFKRSNESFCIADAGTVLMVMSDIPNGKAIAKCFFVDKDNTYTVNQRICALKPKIDAKYLFYKINRNPFYLSFDDGVKQTNLKKDDVLSCKLGIPKSLGEQQAIATVLSDTDELISSLEALIAKKRRIKEGAMQELLTGKKRLAGFSGEWEVKQLVEIADFYDNLRVPIAESKREDGVTPYYGANGIQGYIKGHTHDGEFVLIAEDGANDLKNYPVQYVNGKVWVNNHAHVIQGIKGCADTKYLSYALKIVNFVQILVGGTRAKLNGSVAKSIKIEIPNDIAEQIAIAQILSDMDSEITALEAKCDKYKLVKQGLMQVLLTGKIRLISK